MPHDHPVFKITDRNDPITDAYILGIYEIMRKAGVKNRLPVKKFIFRLKKIRFQTKFCPCYFYFFLNVYQAK
jgi:hypothetical protein